MKIPLSLVVLALLAVPSAAQAPAARPGVPAPTAGAALPKAPGGNPFFQPSALPYGLPPFDRIKDGDFQPAFEAGMAEELQEAQAIARDGAAPTFENTIVALERSGRLLRRVEKTFSNLNASNTDDELQKLDVELAPKLAAHEDAILLDAPLFARVKALYDRRTSLNLDAEGLQALERRYKSFVRAGALLSEADKTQLKKLNEELSTLTTRFEQNLLKADKDGSLVVERAEDLAGLSPEEVAAAAEAAKGRGLTGKWVLSLQNTTIQPALEHLASRAVREKLFRASVSRAQAGEADNVPLVARIAALRARQAALLGYPSYAAYVLEDESAGTPAAVNKMLRSLAPAALAQARKEAADIQRLIDAQAKAARRRSFKLQAWDWAFYARQVRDARFGFTDDRIKPYFELDRVLKDGVFYAAHELYGVTFKERPDLPRYRADVRVFEVFDADGSSIGLLIHDPFKRDNKNGGAWMDEYVTQSRLLGQKPVVVNNLNVPKPPEGQPALLTFDEVTTLFHEFGHALHGLFSDAEYPSLAGTDVPRDFVEYPSQQNEMWARDPQVLAHFARHFRTGEPMPKDLLAKVLAAQNYGEGFATTEYVAAAMLDQSWHQLAEGKTPAPSGVMAFEDAALKGAGLAYAPIPPRYRTPYFAHAFSGGYAAGYYAYVWSEVLARDTGAWFMSHGGLNRANGDFYRAKILSRGRTTEPGLLFSRFYGRAPEIGPLLEYRGLK